MKTINKIHYFFIYLYCFSLSFERIDLFGLGIDFLSSKITIVLLLLSSILRGKHYFNIRRINYYTKPLFIIFIYLTFLNYLNINYISSKFVNVSFFLNISVFVVLLNTSLEKPQIAFNSLIAFSLGNAVLVSLYLSGISVSSYGDRQSIFGINPNILGLMLGVSLSTLIVLIQNSSIRNKIFGYLYTPFLFMMLIKTGSRTAFLVFILSLILFVLFSSLNKLKKIFFILMSLVATFFIWFLYLKDSLIVSRLGASVNSGDLSARDLIWVEIFKKMDVRNYVFGIGESGYQAMMDGAFGMDEGAPSPHNVFIELFCYTGVFGLLFFTRFLYRVVKTSLIKNNNTGDILALMFLIPIFGVLLSGQIINQKYVWLLFVYIVSNRVIIKLNRNKHSIR